MVSNTRELRIKFNKRVDFLEILSRIIYYIPADEYINLTERIQSLICLDDFNLDRFLTTYKVSKGYLFEKVYNKLVNYFESINNDLAIINSENKNPLVNIKTYTKYYDFFKYAGMLLSEEKIRVLISVIKHTSWYNESMSKDMLLPILEMESQLSGLSFSLFGSYSRGSEKDISDIDIIDYISPDNIKSLKDTLRYMRRNLEKKTGRIVNLSHFSHISRLKDRDGKLNFLMRIRKDVIHFVPSGIDCKGLDKFFDSVLNVDSPLDSVPLDGQDQSLYYSKGGKSFD